MRGSDYFLKKERTHNSHRGIIVGFDPGLTVGIAILDLNGVLISLESYKEIKKSEIVSHIIAYGRTVLLATDVYPSSSKNCEKAGFNFKFQNMVSLPEHVS